MIGKGIFGKSSGVLNVSIIFDYIDFFFTNWENMFNFESYFICNFASNLKKLGHNVSMVLPFHKSIENTKKFKEMKFVKSDTLFIPDRDFKDERKVEAMFYVCDDINIIFIKDPIISDRNGFMYDPSNGLFYPDNLYRFSIFARASLESLKLVPFRPNVVHVVGKWSSISSIYFKTLYKYDNFFRSSKVIFTLPSLEDLPTFVVDQYPLLGLDWGYYRYEYLEFYGKVNIIKGAIVFSDFTTFVSHSYLDEIQREPFGRGLEGVIVQKLSEGKIKGILPGVISEFNPQNDKELSRMGLNYSRGEIEKKRKIKSIICKKNKISENKLLFLFMGEFKETTGISLVYEVFSEILNKANFNIILIGKGEGFRETAIGELVSKYSDRCVWIKELKPEEVTSYISGADVILIPSIMESNSILPMVSMKYGTLPLVNGVGILNDVVRDKINGFKFYEYSAESFKSKISEIMDICYKNPKRWEKLMDTAMKMEFSWEDSVKTYVQEVYADTKKK